MSSDREWEAWGQRDPYFGVLTEPRFRRAVLTEAARAEFFASGEHWVDQVMATVRREIDPQFAPRRVLDFGCGTGRLLIPFARVCEAAVGIDIAPSMLAEARHNCARAGVENVTLLQSDERLSALTGSFDLIHSMIVLQHIEPARVRRILARLLEQLAHGGVGALHVLYARSRYKRTFGTPPLLSDPRWRAPLVRLRDGIAGALGRPRRDPGMQMNPHNLNALFFLLHASGVKRVVSELVDQDGELGVMLYFRRPATAGSQLVVG